MDRPWALRCELDHVQDIRGCGPAARARRPPLALSGPTSVVLLVALALALPLTLALPLAPAIMPVVVPIADSYIRFSWA